MIENSIYKEIYPKPKELKDLIKLYYVHASTDNHEIQNITYFPNYVSTLNVYENSQVTWDDLSRTHTYQESKVLLKLLITKFDVARGILMKGAFNKVTIVFHPLGLNHFLNVPLSNFTQDHFCLFDFFGQRFDHLMKQVFNEQDINKKGALLDEFFCENRIGFNDQRIIQSVKWLLDSSGELTIQEIAEKLNISRKTLLRIFKKHLAYTPSEFKSIIKFRKTLENYQDKNLKPNFSTLAQEGNYYDQSDLNFHFKNKTGSTPKQLMAAIQTNVKGLYWKIDSVPKVQSS